MFIPLWVIMLIGLLVPPFFYIKNDWVTKIEENKNPLVSIMLAFIITGWAVFALGIFIEGFFYVAGI